jgi:hypothetical protein
MVTAKNQENIIVMSIPKVAWISEDKKDAF